MKGKPVPTERIRITEAARRLDISGGELLRLVDDGRLAAVRDPELGMAIPADALERYQAEHATS